MKNKILTALLVTLLLSGCSADNGTVPDTVESSVTTVQTTAVTTTLTT